MAVTIGEVQMRFISHADFTRDSSPHRTKSGLVWHERSPLRVSMTHCWDVRQISRLLVEHGRLLMISAQNEIC